jgi:hypothetical protein
VDNVKKELICVDKYPAEPNPLTVEVRLMTFAVLIEVEKEEKDREMNVVVEINEEARDAEEMYPNVPRLATVEFN